MKSSQRRSLLAPMLVILALLVLIPLAITIGYSFTDANLLRSRQGLSFVGLENYQDMFSDGLFLSIVGNSLVYSLVCTVSAIIFGLIIAICLNLNFRGRGLFRAILLIPWIIPSAVASLGFRWMYHGIYGIFNAMLMNMGLISEPILFITDPRCALLSVCVVTIWKACPIAMIMLLGSLQGVSLDLYESARVDGASAVKQFFYVTLPSIRPVLFSTTLVLFLWILNFTDPILIITDGGPSNSTQILSSYSYYLGISSQNVGGASAYSVFSLLITCILVAVTMRHSEVEDNG